MTEARAHFDDGLGALIASGAWQADSAAALPDLSGKQVRILDGAGVTQLDTNGAWLLLGAARPQAGDPLPELRAFQPQHLAILNLVERHHAATAAQPGPRHEGVLEMMGRSTLSMWAHVIGLLDFVGRLFVELGGLIGRPRDWRWREFGAQMSAVFAGAIPIVIGDDFPRSGWCSPTCWAYRRSSYGANIFVVDGIAPAVLREISPVIAAVLVAGRSGAAITAQIGTMKVNEEVDAITTLGLSP